MIEFTVHGHPQQKGSKRSIRMPNGRVATVDMNQRARAWQDAVSTAAAEAYQGELLNGPVKLGVRFCFARPKSHYGTGKNSGILKSSASKQHAKTPDLDKLLRTLGDALTGIIVRDDSQIAYVVAEKVYANQDYCAVRIEEL